MEDLWDRDYLKKRGLIFWWKYLPYNPKLKERAKEMRKNMTIAERKIWKSFLQKYNKKWIEKITIIRQKVIDNYIVDFYVPSLKLIIEIDGEIHDNRKWYDEIRTEILKWYQLNEIRFTNKEILTEFDMVIKKLEKLLKHK